jgi:catechol 2,3-dioxygenase-like lactoylglutathione lyase family enzyme
MALLAVDHIVLIVPDLAAATRDYGELGFSVVRGGAHPAGTHNALIALSDRAYIELIAFERENPQHRWWPAAQQGDGLIDFCMRTDDLAGDMENFRKAGVTMRIEPGARTRPDGYGLRWRLAQPVAPYAFVAPFLIEDETLREERVPREHRHRNDVVGIASIQVAVPDLAEPRNWGTVMFGRGGEDMRDGELAARGVRFQAGPHAIEFLAPEQASLLSRRLAHRGAGPWSVTLKTSGNPGTLPEAKAHARMKLVR